MRRTLVAFIVVVVCGMAWAPSALATSCTYSSSDPQDRNVTLSISSGHTVSFALGSTGAWVWIDETNNTASTCTGTGTGTKTNTDFVNLLGTSGNETLRMDDGGDGGPWAVAQVAAVVVDLGGGTDRVDIEGSENADDYSLNMESDGTPRLGTSANPLITGLDNVELFQMEGFGGDDRLAAQSANGPDSQAFNLPVTFDGGNDDDTISGGPAGDVIQGNFGNDTLRGNGGNDIITGGPDNDTYITPTNDGSDSFAGSSGVDTVDYSGRTAAVTVDQTTLNGDGQSGENDSIASDVDNVTTGSGADHITMGILPNVVHAGAGNDTINGGLGIDSLDGGADSDTFLSPTNDGADHYTGGTGTDTISYAGRTAGVTVGLVIAAGDGEAGENDTVGSDIENVVGGNGDDTLVGSSPSKLLGTVGINRLDGGPGDDTITGGGGNDTLIGNLDDDTFLTGSAADGSDVISGGPGTDTADYSPRTADLTFTLDSGENDGAAGENDDLEGIENLTTGSGSDHVTGNIVPNSFILGDGNDTVLSPTLDGADTIEGGAGTDTIDYTGRTVGLFVLLDTVANDGQPGENDNVLTDVENVIGGSGSDRMLGSPSANTLSGGGGNDFMEGGAGADTFNGGPGTDQVEYTQDATVTVTLDGIANDGTNGGAEGDNADADGSVENVLGSPTRDIITGNALANTLTGGFGNDVLRGGPGNDTFVATLSGASDGADVFNGGPDADTVTYAVRTGAVTVTLDGTANDGLVGEGDNVQGSVENIIGGFGADTLTGNGSSNVLIGGPGNDSLFGKLGADTFLMRDGSADTADGGQGTDQAQIDGGIDTTTAVETFIP